MSQQNQSANSASHKHQHDHTHQYPIVETDVHYNTFQAALRWAKMADNNTDILKKKGIDKLWLIISAIIVASIIVWVIAWYINSKKDKSNTEVQADANALLHPPASNTQPDAVPPLPVNNKVQVVHNGGDIPAATMKNNTSAELIASPILHNFRQGATASAFPSAAQHKFGQSMKGFAAPPANQWSMVRS